MKYKFYLLDNEGKKIYEKECFEESFRFMDFFEEALADGVDRESINIPKSLAKLNENENFSAKSILAIDDEEMALTVYKKYLGLLGHYIEVYPSAAQALGALREDTEKFDLVLTDQNMPGVDGSEFIYDVHKNHNPDLAIYILTGNPDDVPSIISSLSNFRGTINKPLDPSSFAMTVGRGSRFANKRRETRRVA